MLELRFKLQKNHISKTSKKSKIAHLCLRTCFCSKINKNPKNTLKIQKKSKKKYFFLNQFQILKFLTIKFLRCNIYQISNDNINYVPKANLPKQNHSSWLFVQKIQKNKKKVKTQKHKNNSRIAIWLLSHHQTHFSNEQNCLIALFKTFYFLSIFIIPHSHNDVQYFWYQCYRSQN